MKNQMKRITILLADDHPMARAGIRNLLEIAGNFDIVGEAEDGYQARELVEVLQPDVLLLDLKMPGLRPAELEKWVRENFPQIVTLVLTSHDRDRYLAAMMEAGASGYMDKNVTAETLAGAIQRAVNGEILFDQKQMQRAQNWRETVGQKENQLTEQEIKLLELLVKGLDNNKISQQLNVTEKTVAYHLTSIFQKLGVKSRLEAAIWAKDELFDELE